MDDFTLINLKDDVEDQAPKHGLSPMIEARPARVPLGLQDSGASYYRFAPNYRTFGHHHTYQEEVYVILSGRARAKLGETIVDLRPWDTLRVAPETPRAFEAGPEGVELLAFGAPSRDNGDAQMLAGWWTDEP
jgi:mannose-6-phosphate isomerase-like protein (cupin superfamily)